METCGHISPSLPAAADVLDALRDFARDRALPASHCEIERRFLHMEKLLTLGQVTTEVAHDFGNLMTVVLGYSDLLLNSVPNELATRTYLEHLHRAAEHAAALTSQLLGYMRDVGAAERDVDLAALVRGLEPMLGRLLGRNVHLTVHADPGDCAILADPKRIEQAIVNLAVNARDSMIGSGSVTIEVAERSFQQPIKHRLGLAPAGDYVMLRIHDDGAGMDTDTVDRLFQPFFTTKAGGTGLGLAIVARVARECRAAVLVDSEPGCGTTFTVYFPRIAT